MGQRLCYGFSAAAIQVGSGRWIIRSGFKGECGLALSVRDCRTSHGLGHDGVVQSGMALRATVACTGQSSSK